MISHELKPQNGLERLWKSIVPAQTHRPMADLDNEYCIS